MFEQAPKAHREPQLPLFHITYPLARIEVDGCPLDLAFRPLLRRHVTEVSLWADAQVAIMLKRMAPQMLSSGDNPLGQRPLLFRWVLVIALAIAALTCSLVTRTFHLTVPQGVTAQSAASQAFRQHMDRDAAKWVPPVTIAVTLQAPSFYPHVAPAGPPLPAVLFDESLSNRPPPSR